MNMWSCGSPRINLVKIEIEKWFGLKFCSFHSQNFNPRHFLISILTKLLLELLTVACDRTLLCDCTLAACTWPNLTFYSKLMTYNIKWKGGRMQAFHKETPCVLYHSLTWLSIILHIKTTHQKLTEAWYLE
jgi:hypothetical protein